MNRTKSLETSPVQGGPGSRQSSIDSKQQKEDNAAALKADNRYYFSVCFAGRTVKALFDPGAMVSLIDENVAQDYKDRLKPAQSAVKGISGKAMRIAGLLEVILDIDGLEQKIDLRVMEGLDHGLLLGMDFCRKWKIEVSLGEGLWRIKDGSWRDFSREEEQIVGRPKIVMECCGISEVQQEQRQLVDALVTRIVPPATETLSCTSLIEHHIEVIPGSIPFKHSMRRMAPAILNFAQEEVLKMQREGIIERSASAWSSAPVIVRQGEGKYRFCVDYRDLNKITKRDAYPMPNMDSILDKLRKARFISKIDLRKAYHQIPLSNVSKKYTAFAVQGSGLWQFIRMPFGLMNAPMTFARLIDALFGPEVEPFVFGYLDDLIVVTETFKDHLKWLEFVLRRVIDAGLVLNRDKCEFCCDSVLYLGYRLDKSGLRPDADRVAPVINFPVPKNVKQLRSFLGMVGWYSRFIKSESDLKIPLVKLLRKTQEWEWKEDQQEAFESLKRALAAAPVLARPDFTEPFTVQCDASDYAVGAVLTQVSDDGEHPIVYVSRVLNSAEKNYTTTEKECLALLWAIKKFRPYIEGSKFTAITDHSALKWLRKLKEPSGRLARWVLEMQQWDFDIIHKKGALHHVPDALSRGIVENSEDEEVAGFETITDPWYLRRMEDLQQVPFKYPNWKIEDGMLYRYVTDSILGPVMFSDEGWRLVVPLEHRERVLKDSHCHISSGHFGIEKTYERVAREYYWIGMYYDTRNFVNECQACQRYKVSQQGPQGLMGRRVVDRPWAVVSADVMEFPKSKSQCKYAIVFQDLFTKWIELKPLRSANGKTITRAFEELILFRWESPDYLLTDNGTEFDNNLLEGVLKEYGIKRVTTPSYHPQANPVERANRTLKTLIAMFVEADHRTWDEHLHELRHAMNTAVQASTKVSPAFLNFGRHPTAVKSLRKEVEKVTTKIKIDTKEWMERLQRLDSLRDLVRKHLESSQDRNMQAYNRGKRNVSFHVGDLVMRKDRVLSSGQQGFSSKLAPKFAGPFTIKEVLSPVVYLLEGTGRRVAKAHVSELKKYIPLRSVRRD